jgi:stearoyl-CoA desaturase (delta-9 desaturase)
MAAEKSAIDLDTVKAVITNRFQILAQYASDVIKPVIRQQKQAGLLHADAKARKSLVRDKNLIDESGRKSLQTLLADNSTLKEVYQFREQLQSIWARTTASQKELLEALQDWCARAENTGISVLAEFARTLKRYSLLHQIN